jgi:SWI/SNF-related matrix-associated actin-dependent regulator of chromatin subfamily A3
MARRYRGRDEVDLTQVTERRGKIPKTAHGSQFSSQSGSFGNFSSQSRLAFQAPHPTLPAPSLSPDDQFALTQIADIDDDELGQTQEDEDQSLEFYGTLDNKIVGVRYYNGIATPHELVAIRREPSNPYDRNAVRVDNALGQQIGHLPRKVVEKLAPYIDRRDIVLEGVLNGQKGPFDCPIKLYIYGSSQPLLRAALEQKLKDDKILKATELKRTQKEAEARRKQLQDQQGKTTDLKSGTSSGGVSASQQDASLESLIAASEAIDATRTDELTDTLSSGEAVLKSMPMADQPAALRSTLLPYQCQGLAWMMSRENPQLPAARSDRVVQLWKRDGDTRYTNLGSGFTTASTPRLLSGGILADDMGLGKTLQMISLVLSSKNEGPTLIVAPLSVLSNWESQIQFHVHEEHMPRILMFHPFKPLSTAEMQRYDVVITSYGNVNQKKVFNPVTMINWRRIILDEGHIIRNSKSVTAQACDKLIAKSRWVLTGTPIINSVKDFSSLVQFLKLTGGLEDDALFSQVITRPIRLQHHSSPQRVRAVKLLTSLLQDICLRRRKDMDFVDLKLPLKTEYVHRVNFDPKEKEKYDAVLAEARGELQEFQAKSKHGQKGRFQNILERLLRLRQVCDHWALCKERVEDLLALYDDQKIVSLNPETTKVLQQALQLMIESQEECAICYEYITMHEPVVTACKHVFGKPCIAKAIEMQGKCPMCRAELAIDHLIDPAPDFDTEAVEGDDPGRSSKTEAIVKIIEATIQKAGSKVIVFSQWTSYLNIIQQRLAEAKLKSVRIDGSMVKKDRDASIAALNEDPTTRILLASLQVASVGLNLVAADTVILSDSWWAPAIEDQAVDRVHRLGQTRPTTVWRMVVEGSIEERVLEIQAEKRRLVGEAFQEKAKGPKAKETRMADIARLLA